MIVSEATDINSVVDLLPSVLLFVILFLPLDHQAPVF